LAAQPPPTDALALHPPAGLARLIALNASALTLGRLLSAALSVVGVGITTRYLGLEVYGTFVTITVFTTLVGSLTDMGIWTIGARELAKRPAETQRLMSSLFTIGVGLALFAAALGLGIGYVIYSAPVEREGIAILMLLPLPIAAAAAPAGAYVIAMQRGYIAALASIVATVAMTLVLVLAVTLDLGFTAVLLANAAQSIAFGAVILAYTIPRIRFRPSWDAALCKQLFKWAIPLGVVYLLSSLYWRIDIVLLSLTGSQQAVGIYGLAYKVVDTLYILPAVAMWTLLPALARPSEDPGRRDELVQKASTVMQVAIVPLLVFTFAFADEITTLAGGKAFVGAAMVLRILMLGVAAGFLRAVLTQALIAANHQVWLIYATGALLAVNIALNLALIPVLGARGAAIAFAASEMVALVLLVLLFRRIGVPPRPHRLPQVLLAGCAMTAVTLLTLAPIAGSAGPLTVIVVLGSLSGAVYAASLYALGAMPREIHSTLVAPLLARLQARRSTA
jgi:O-antigen/teichoic acid export membrane protein